MKPDITLRHATIEDQQLLEHWDRQPHVIACAPNDEWDWATELNHHPEWRSLLIAMLDGRPIGFVQIIDPFIEETHYWGDVAENLRALDIWLGEESDLGKGYGTKIMQQVIDRCFEDENVTGILIDPLANNVKAQKFYEQLGFTFVEERSFDEDDCFVYRLDRERWAGYSVR